MKALYRFKDLGELLKLSLLIYAFSIWSVGFRVQGSEVCTAWGFGSNCHFDLSGAVAAPSLIRVRVCVQAWNQPQCEDLAKLWANLTRVQGHGCCLYATGFRHSRA